MKLIRFSGVTYDVLQNFELMTHLIVLELILFCSRLYLHGVNLVVSITYSV
jgi:hypothetical protein